MHVNPIESHVAQIFQKAGITGPIEFSRPPKPEMGDFAFPCFVSAKEAKKSPVEVAKEIAVLLTNKGDEAIQSATAFGPYVNITLEPLFVANLVLHEVSSSTFGVHGFGKEKYLMVEYGCLNVLKAMHLGHLKNLVTGEAVARLMENSGYAVKRITYQGDVGMHIGKALWGIIDWFPQFEALRNAPAKERVEFLGKAYAHGAQHYEKGEKEKEEVVHYNDVVYEGTETESMVVYNEARSWSLEYFEEMYQKLGTKYDGYYFESQMYKRGIAIVDEYTKEGVFRKSEGAIIFPGSEFGLHDRVFINSKGHPTYEAKDLARSEVYFTESPMPDKVIHVVGKEQTEYFKVVFKAMEEMKVAGAGKESHLIGGFLQLKGDQKMSSRTGHIITGDALIEAVETAVREQMLAAEATKDKKIQETSHRVVSMAALKYAMLRADVSQDVAFDMEESMSVSGDSGPYLLYIVARIKSIQKKAEGKTATQLHTDSAILPTEKNLLLELANYPTVTAKAAADLDPSHIAKYLFTLAQAFNSFYHEAHVIDEEGNVNEFRLNLIQAVEKVMTKGLTILGIETVDAM
jgi:arginyl-tRNA synthetase